MDAGTTVTVGRWRVERGGMPPPLPRRERGQPILALIERKSISPPWLTVHPPGDRGMRRRPGRRRYVVAVIPALPKTAGSTPTTRHAA